MHHLLPVRGREAGERRQVLGCVAQHRLHLHRLAPEHPCDHPELFAHVRGIGLGEDRTDWTPSPEQETPTTTPSVPEPLFLQSQTAPRVPAGQPGRRCLGHQPTQRIRSCCRPLHPRMFSSGSVVAAPPRVGRQPTSVRPGWRHPAISGTPHVATESARGQRQRPVPRHSTSG
jgi:hypothetical protein